MPDQDRTCLPRPGAPDPDKASDADLVDYIGALIEAHGDCESKLKAVVQIVDPSDLTIAP